MKYFGTDGIRLQNMKLLKKIVIKTAYALKALSAENVVVGYDGRPNGKMLKNTLIKSLNALGVNAHFAGLVPSSCVSFLCVKNNFDFSIMITASHNDANINGIKIFKANGEKLTVAQEKKIEKLFDELPEKKLFANLKKFAKQNNFNKGERQSISIKPYLELLKNNTPNLSKKTLVLDCSNGASKLLAKSVFERSGAKVVTINCGSGRRINKNCGAVHPDGLAKQVLKYKADLGLAFDGDADRCVCVLSDGTRLSGDNVLLALARFYKFEKIVGTIYSNSALDKIFEKENIVFLRSNVGDQEVKKTMNKHKCLFGGERSGHFIFSDILSTGDGMLSGLKISEIKNFEKLSSFKKMPFITINMPTNNKKRDMSKLRKIQPDIKAALRKKGRILIRPSGTEETVRILIEHPSKKTLEKIKIMLLNKFKKTNK